MYVNDMDYQVVKLLGKGKGGYSYLVMRDGKMYVLKKIHHEPCSYYSFGNKLESELGDYVRLRSAGLKLPELFAFDRDREHILKEYIDGKRERRTRLALEADARNERNAALCGAQY